MARCLVPKCQPYLATRSIGTCSRESFTATGTRSTRPQAIDNKARCRLLARPPTPAHQWQVVTGRRWITTINGHGSQRRLGGDQNVIAKEIVDNDTIARLAAEKLHELSLEDLVR